jgi:hypothetical protein
MPSWETAPSRKVEVEEQLESHEMDRLKHDGSPALGSGQVTPPVPRPIPMRNGSGNTAVSSIPGSPRLPGDRFGGNSPYMHGAGGAGYGSSGAVGAPYGSRQDLPGSRTNLMAQQDGYGSGGYRGAAGNAGGGYGNDRYNNNNASTEYGVARDHAPPYPQSASPTYGAGGRGAAGNRPAGYGTPTGTSSYDYAGGSGVNNSGTGGQYEAYHGGSNNSPGGYGGGNSGSNNYNNGGYGGNGPSYGNNASSYANPRAGNSSPRPAQYPGQAAYGQQGQGAGRGGGGWRDI